jgi:ribosomal protein S18 acetylase RimI-like enzyme
MEITYRKLRADDAKPYREIRLESLKAHPESFGSTFEEQSKLPKLMFEKALEQPVDERFVVGAFDHAKMIGICGFVPFALDEALDLEHAGTIIQMYVKSTYRGQRIGLGLVQMTVREAFKVPGIEQVVLGVKEGNLSAIRVYEQAGFETYLTGLGEVESGNEGFRIMIIPRDD